MVTMLIKNHELTHWNTVSTTLQQINNLCFKQGVNKAQKAVTLATANSVTTSIRGGMRIQGQYKLQKRASLPWVALSARVIKTLPTKPFSSC